jgi:hypothetical protein
MDTAGLVMFVAGAAETPRDGNASSEEVSTALGALVELPLVPMVLLPLVLLGAGEPPRVGNGSGAPSRPWR